MLENFCLNQTLGGTEQGGLHKVNLASRPRFQAYRSNHFDAPKFTVFAFAEGADNRLWLGTANGLYLLDKNTKEVIQHFQTGSEDSLGLNQNVIMSLHETAEQIKQARYWKIMRSQTVSPTILS